MRRVWAFALLLVLMAAVFALLNSFRSPATLAPRRVSVTKAPPPAPPLPSSPYRNAAAGIKYVGSTACYDCHEAESDKYRATGMGQSLAPVQPDQEPVSGTFAHSLSGRTYAVYRQDGQFRHRETLSDTSHVLADHDVQFVVGSGNHSRSYLCLVDEFLVESPVTWYTARESWDMSPGYDVRSHSGFRREVPEKCLFCHSGRAVAVGDALHRIRFEEHAIGCERCHGPGELHVRRWTESDHVLEDDKGFDHTIVNPADLSRELAEAVCHQCHLTTRVYVPARERAPADFRPGLPLEYFRHFFQGEDEASSMRVVGHVDQLKLSACYKQSPSLSCITCHNPHAFPSAKDREAFYRNACLQCHDVDRCKVSPDVLSSESPTNDCVHCHMPATDTDIPHLAFTHHRIGIHDGEPPREADEPARVVRLVPFHDLSFLSPLDRDRSLGLAYFWLAKQSATGYEVEAYMERGVSLLRQVKLAGLHDGEVDAALAQAVWPFDKSGALKHANDALQANSLSAISRVNSLYAIAASRVEQHQYRLALPTLQKLITLRRNAGDWMLLGDCHAALNDLTAATEAYEKAVEIDPNLLEIHAILISLYERAGDSRRASQRRQVAASIAEALGVPVPHRP